MESNPEWEAVFLQSRMFACPKSVLMKDGNACTFTKHAKLIVFHKHAEKNVFHAASC